MGEAKWRSADRALQGPTLQYQGEELLLPQSSSLSVSYPRLTIKTRGYLSGMKILKPYL